MIALSFFSGAMGLDLGIEAAGFEIISACDIDSFCRETIRQNRPGLPIYKDVFDFDPQDFKGRDIDLVVGGPPCQPFSTAGKRRGLQDDRGNALLRYVDLAIALRPKYFVLENVRGLLSCKGVDGTPGGAMRSVINRIAEGGYGYSFNLYDAANFGSYQNRERVIIVCSRDGSTAPFLTPTNSKDGIDGFQPWEPVAMAIAEPMHHDYIQFPEKRLKYYRLLGPGQNWRDLPIELQKEAMGNSYYSGGGKTGFYRRLSWESPSPTLVTHPAMPSTSLGHPCADRPLSVQEYKRIQGFPDEWFVAGNLLSQYKQIGNAVPVQLGKAIGTLIRRLINGDEVPTYPSFKYSRYRNTSHEFFTPSNND